VRYQFFDEKVKNPTVYSITAIKGPGVPEGLEAGHILNSTADMWMEINKAESYKETKKFHSHPIGLRLSLKIRLQRLANAKKGLA